MNKSINNTTDDSAKLFADHLRRIDACQEIRDWAKGMDAQQAWDTCKRADWLLWWVARDNPDSKRGIVRVACKIARLVLHVVPASEERPRKAIDAAEKWADDPTPENLEAVRAAQRDSYVVAVASTGAVFAALLRCCCCAVVVTVDAVAAASAVRAVAIAVVAARGDIRAESLSIIREQFSCPWLPVAADDEESELERARR